MAGTQYSPMESQYEGVSSSIGPLTGILESLSIVRAESMDVNNDPRFFHGNVLDKRLGAFKKLTIVSGLMIGISMGQCFKLKKNMDFSDPFGIVQVTGLLIMSCVMFMDITAVFVMAHQMFYTIRLMTAGPSGFEIAATFYLNSNIIMLRHLAIKCLLVSLPLFLVGAGFQLVCAWHKDAIPASEMKDRGLNVMVHDIVGICVGSAFLLYSMMLICVRWTHLAIFRERYELVKMKERPLLTHLETMKYAKKGGLLDT
eukprot:gnl/TRDRNA2_/TRDRNA2_82636_c0_seq1.p1 gnl/TRDRNA2_/TRDRNA2_82636_c0~~gnl/TRDRNA2_/TRDRNA2_82636_c0_seq1.p1  ORF type:complete len:257 (-),score=49.41 gnl/TRDRNA2_/TRDRNA2_82636_c0_seq1:123-893(-)